MKTAAIQFISIDDIAGQAVLLVQGDETAFTRTKARDGFTCRVNGLRHPAGVTRWEPGPATICPIGDMGMTSLRYP